MNLDKARSLVVKEDKVGGVTMTHVLNDIEREHKKAVDSLTARIAELEKGLKK